MKVVNLSKSFKFGKRMSKHHTALVDNVQAGVQACGCVGLGLKRGTEPKGRVLAVPHPISLSRVDIDEAIDAGFLIPLEGSSQDVSRVIFSDASDKWRKLLTAVSPGFETRSRFSFRFRGFDMESDEERNDLIELMNENFRFSDEE